MAYASLAEFKEMNNVRDEQDNVSITLALNAATADVDLWCGVGGFEQDSTATVRRFSASGACVNLGRSVFATTTGLIITTDDNDDGTAETTWTAADYELLPLDGVGPNGRTGWPYTEIRAVASKAWPTGGVYNHRVYVTAKWGWATTPAPVKYATLLLAADHWWSRNAPNGQSGFGDVDPGRLLRQNFKVQELLAPYRAGTSIVGVG